MKRILFELLLVVSLSAAGFFGWTNWKAGLSNVGKLTELTAESQTSTQKLATAEAELKANAEELDSLKIKTQELDAVKAALVNGETLKDLEAAYKKEKSLSAERLVGLGAVRLLTMGSKDPATIEAFRKALDVADWGSRKKVICAAQIALAAAGEKGNVLDDCATSDEKPVKSDKTESEKPASPSSAKPASPEKTAKVDKAKDEKGAKKAEKVAFHWGYEGATGPDHWGEEYPTCAKGMAQSPLNIKGPFEKAPFGIAPDYKMGQLKIINNGHTIQVNVPPGSKLRIDSKPFELVQFHFHRPSENLINGKPAAMVVHFVHKNEAGRIAVLAVMLKEGNENPGIDKLWSYAPQTEGPEVEPNGVTFNPANLLPREHEFYSYEGSLTTPPCTEGVRFFVLKTQVNIAREQIDKFPFKMNARPVQAQNGRAIAG
jgi:carbonic anhydrase